MITNKSHNILLIASLCTSLSYGKEISVFGAGNLENSSPYGLSKAEKAVLKNNEKVDALSSKIDALELKLRSFESKQDDIKQKIEGIKSVYESDSQSMNDTKLDLKSTETKIEENKALLGFKIDENSKKIEELNKKLDSFIILQKKNNKLLEESNSKLLEVINKINADYVTKAQYDELVGFINKSLSEQSKSFTETSPKKADNLSLEKLPKETQSSDKKELKKEDKTDYKKLFVEATKNYQSNYISKALPMFEQLVENKYKLDESSFYLAEIKYRKKEYNEAIQSYKQSMIANDKADYIPTLLLHSAYSFEGINQKDNAINFYKTIIDVYPKTVEAKDAAKKLKEYEDATVEKKAEKKAEKSTKKTKKMTKDKKKK